MKLQPVIVTIHLLLGMSLLALLAWAGARQNDHQPVATIAMKLRVPATAALALLFIQIALGGWVSTNYAALACLDFPMCDGALIPQMDFGNGFTLWRDLGKTASGDYLPFPALTAIHWVHRMFAFVVVLFIVWAAHKAMQIEGLQRVGKWLLVAVVVQFFIGVSTIFLRWPLALAVAHNGGATVLVMLLVMLNYRTRIPGQTATDQAITRLSTA
jgi:cytochrome c oxidase assembly protein subunit 15